MIQWFIGKLFYRNRKNRKGRPIKHNPDFPVLSFFTLNIEYMNLSKHFMAPVNSMKPIYIVTLIAFSLLFNLQAQNIQPRLNQGAILEPQGRIINGAGQDLLAFRNYSGVMHTHNKPVIYMTYVGLKNVTSDWANSLKSELMANTGQFVIPQIGLSMTEDGNPSAHYEQDVAAGMYDKQITMFIDGLQSLALPAYVRIGYEFNGVSWNGYQANTYKLAFQRITDMIRARGVEVATVWCFAMDGVMNFADFYPGDAYVDWWAIDIFSATHFTDANAISFVNAARIHAKPVMIGETTPRNIGVLNSQLSWNQWFVPFFTFIRSHPEVKAFCYINWNWSQYPQWSNWGDARLEQNAIVGGNFANEMDSAQYLHASAESVFRKTLGSSDNTAPPSPGTISVTQPGYPLQLSWNSVTDLSGLSHYIVYKNGALADYTLTLPYSDKNVSAGEVITYAVSAMDRAGNESGKTADLKVTMPSTLSKALNGEFDNGTQYWQLSTYASGAVATMKIDSSSVISGRKSCAVSISQSTGTDWHIQLWQWLSIQPAQKYTITFKAKASASRKIALSVQQGSSPYTTYLNKTHTLTTNVQTFTDEVTITTADQAKLEFYLGGSTASVWIDAVSIVESSTTGINKQRGTPGNLYLQQNYPNPFTSATTIKFKVTKSGFVSLKVFNEMGRQVSTLVNKKLAPGVYEVVFDGRTMSGGTYFYKLETEGVVETTKMVLINQRPICK
jgi:hypothetical protein